MKRAQKSTASVLTRRAMGIAASALLFLTSCSGPGFKRAWREALADAPSTGVEGAWQGTWASTANNHKGNLRCVVTAPEQAGDPHQFHYHATWMGFLSGAYKARHLVKPAGPGQWTFAGEHQMPSWAGGLYHYQGTITGDEFKANYRCEADHGNYLMTRAAP